jgi:hypothetical protein
MLTELRQVQVTRSAVRKPLSQIQYGSKLFAPGNAISLPDPRMDI